MNKKLLIAGITTAMAAPLSALAGSDITLYGKAHISQDYVDVDERIKFSDYVDEPVCCRGRGDTPPPYDGWDTVSRASRLGVKGSEDLGGGLKAIFKMEFDIPMTDRSTGIRDNDQGRIKMRNSYVGLSGKWGTGLIGRHDTPLKVSTGRLDLFSDRLADYNATVGFVDVRVDNIVAYISPSWNGLSFAGAIVSPGGSTLTNTEGDGWRGDGSGNQKDADGIADAWSAAIMYTNGPWYCSAAYEFYDSDMLGPRDSVSGADSFEEDFKLWRLGFGYNAESWGINLIYEGHKDDPVTSGDYDPVVFTNDGGSDPWMWQIQGQYKFGNNVIKAMHGHFDGDDKSQVNNFLPVFYATGPGFGKDDNEDHDTYAIGFDHNFSKRTSAYLVYTDYDSDYKDSDWNGGSLGVIHKF